MRYCPYCSASLEKSTQVCPECNKSLDIPLLSHYYRGGETTRTNRSAARKIWIREHAFTVLPLLGMLVGLVLGFVLCYGYFTMKTASDRARVEERISALQDSIKMQASAAGDVTAGLHQQITTHEETIKILKEQIDILEKIITFTRRFATNSELTTLDEAEIESFRRNVNYLINQFKMQQEKLISSGQAEETTVNLIPVPQVFE